MVENSTNHEQTKQGIPGFNDFHNGFVPNTEWTEKAVKTILKELEGDEQKPPVIPFVLSSSSKTKAI